MFKLITYEIILIFYVIIYTLGIFVICYTYSALQHQYRRDEIQMKAIQQHVYSSIALNVPVSIKATKFTVDWN
jgi:hypothetical protein